MNLAPMVFNFILQRLFMGGIFILVEWYMFNFYIIPFFLSKVSNYILLFLIIVWIVVSLIWLYSYFLVCWFDAGSVKFEIEKMKIENPNVTFDVFLRCSKCQQIKPYRTHHCSKCGQCYIRFDHHCPLTGNCIAYNNAQPFALFLVYGDIMFLFISLFSFLAPNFHSSKINFEIAKVISVLVFFLFIALFIFAKITCDDLIAERTAYERNYQKNNISKRQNVFFYDHYWFLPHSPSINGLIWEGAVSYSSLFQKK